MKHLGNIRHSYARLDNHWFVKSKVWFEKLIKDYTLHILHIKFLGEQPLGEAEPVENYKKEQMSTNETVLYRKKLPLMFPN